MGTKALMLSSLLLAGACVSAPTPPPGAVPLGLQAGGGPPLCPALSRDITVSQQSMDAILADRAVSPGEVLGALMAVAFGGGLGLAMLALRSEPLSEQYRVEKARYDQLLGVLDESDCDHIIAAPYPSLAEAFPGTTSARPALDRHRRLALLRQRAAARSVKARWIAGR